MEMNEKQALQLIEQMIGSAKREVKDNGFFFLLWGWLVFAGALIDFALLKNIYPEWQSKHALVWAILMPLGGIVTFIAGRREASKPVRVKTYIDELMNYVVKAFVISLVIVCFLMPATSNWPSFFPVLIILYAVWLYISGGALRFKPLIYGGLANWLFAFAAFFVSYDIQLLLLAAAVLIGYIVPGHLLQRNYNKDVQGA
jgi:hypothetical protein